MEHPAVHYLFADCGGRLVEIHDYDRAALAHVAGAGPVCPACRAELVAVQGERRGWHFRHRSGGGCSEADYAAACAALERGAAGAADAAAPWWEHPLIVGVGLLAAAGFIFLVGEARRR